LVVFWRNFPGRFKKSRNAPDGQKLLVNFRNTGFSWKTRFPPLMGGATAILHYMLWLSRSFCRKVTIEIIANKIKGFDAF
jgi:hypothetical protein